VTLRYDAHGRPVGLDWTVCNDGNPQPHIWSDWQQRLLERKKKHPNTLNPGIGRGGNVWMGAEMERQIIDVYTMTRFGPYDIAEMFQITHKTVYRVLHRNDIPLRAKQKVVA
jgi:hypothetical protein